MFPFLCKDRRRYDDIFRIGCIGLCKAAATDKGGTFFTYAYRLIWNEICDALPGKGTIWRCECECGGEKEVLAAYFLEHWERIKMVMS